MCPSSDDKNPIVEPAPGDDRFENLTDRALRQRIKQQELLAELGVLALQGTTFMDMLQHGARITAEGLKAEYCKVLEYTRRKAGFWFVPELAGRKGLLARQVLEPTLNLPAVTRCGPESLLFPTTSKMSSASERRNCLPSMVFVAP